MNKDIKDKCGFCYENEQNTHGEVKREWSKEWGFYIPVCREHSFTAYYNKIDCRHAFCEDCPELGICT